ncbi:MAG: phosphotransferase [Phycisphaeraceae bacterium]|nr:MAG: phosphotransferase [Phycisphaeraceae bacterium]
MTTPAPSRNANQDRRPLDADECRAVVGRYGLAGVSGVRDFARGNPRSPKAIVEARSGRFLLKRRAPGLDDYARLQTEHAAQTILQGAGRPVPAPLSTPDGETIVVHERRLYELYPYIEAEGWMPGPDSARAAGLVLASLHDTLARLDVPADAGPTDLVAPAFDHLASSTPALRPSLERLHRDWESAMLHLEHVPLSPPRLTHGDYHPGNTLWRAGDIVAVVDFETMRPAPHAAEAALAALLFSLDTTGDDPESWPDAPILPRLESFWAGYGAERFDRSLTGTFAWLMINGLIAEAVPRACRHAGFGRHDTGLILPFIARLTAWLSEHADGLGVVLSQAGD